MSIVNLSEAFHAAAPSGHRCADCTMGTEPCPTCYAVWWQRKNPTVHLHGSPLEAVMLRSSVRKTAMDEFNDVRANSLKPLAP
jgi:hypothetical protein